MRQRHPDKEQPAQCIEFGPAFEAWKLHGINKAPLGPRHCMVRRTGSNPVVSAAAVPELRIASPSFNLTV
jgi:hypothetical protein